MNSLRERRRRPWLRRVLVLAVLAAAVVFLFLWLRGPQVPSAAVLVLDLRSPIPERVEEGWASLLGARAVDLLGLRRALQAAAADQRVRGLLLRVGAGMDLAQAEELRSMAERFRRRGKFLLGFGEGPDGPGLLLLSAANEVVLDPAADVQLLGVSLTTFFPGQALRRMGLEFDLMRVGDYKGAYEQLALAAPSPEFLKSLEETASSLYSVLVERIAGARGIELERLKMLVDEGPLAPARALEGGLADRLAYRDKLPSLLAQHAGEPVEIMGLASYLSAVGRQGRGARVAVVHLRGILADVAGPTPALLGEVTPADEAASALRRAREDPSVHGVVLRIDSPGGTIAAAERIWREVEVTRRTKPVVATLARSAASGGYYVACASNHLLAHPATITGSIGVFGGKLVVEGLLGELGITLATASKGRRAGMFDITRPFSEDERSALQRILEDAYRQFLDRVAGGRGKSIEEVEGLAEGRIWTGSQAVERGLVDELGGLEEAVEVVRRLARLPGDQRVDLVPLPPRRTLLEVLAGSRREVPLARPLLAEAARLEAGPLAAIEGLKPLLDGRHPLALGPLELSAR